MAYLKKMESTIKKMFYKDSVIYVLKGKYHSITMRLNGSKTVA